MAGNITMTRVSSVDENDQPLTTIYQGDPVYIRADFNTKGLPLNASYTVRYIANPPTGQTLNSTPINYGAGGVFTQSWNEYWGPFIAEGGPENFLVTVNPDRTVAESNYTDNSLTLTINAITAPDHLMIPPQNSQPPSFVTAGALFGLTVDVMDVHGNLVKNDTGPVTVSLAGNPGNSVLGGHTTIMASGGVATFTDLTLPQVGTGYTLFLSRPESLVTGTTTSPFNVVPAAAAMLVISQQPNLSVPAGINLIGLQVSVEDQYGNLKTDDNSTAVTATLASGTGPLLGQTGVTAIGGVATFASLADNTAEVVSINLTSGFLTPVTTRNLTITPGTPSKLIVLQQPSPMASAGQAFAVQPMIEEQDRFGNRVTGDNSSVVTASLASGTGSLLGLKTAVFSGGVATFANLGDSKSETASLRFTGVAPNAATSANIAVAKGTPTISWVPGILPAGSPLGAAQLDAVAMNSYSTIPGTFAYSPASGTVLAAGSYPISVTFTPTNSADYTTAQATSTILVLPATSTSLTVSAAMIVYGQPLTITALVSPITGGATPTGSITFLDGTTVLGSFPLDGNGRATFTTTRALPGTLPITARYSGDPADAPSTSSAAIISVRKPAGGDFDGDGKSDVAVFQPTTSTFFITPSSHPTQPYAVQFGQGTASGGNPTPVVGDFDGDGKADVAIYQPSTSTFFVIPSSHPTQPYAVQFGQGSASGGNPTPVVGDFDGDGKTDIAIYQPSTSTFFVMPSSAPGQPYAIQFGQGTLGGGHPVPIVSDFDGDGKTDIAVFQPTTSTFFVMPSTNPAQPYAVQFGQGSAAGGNPVPIVGDFDGDGKTDVAVYQPSTSTFFVIPSANPTQPYAVQLGQGTAGGGNPVPVVGDFDGDGKVDVALFQPSTSTFFIMPSSHPGQPYPLQFGQGSAAGGRPVPLLRPTA